MADKDRPQITLITPPAYDWEVFPDTLARALDAVEVACLRLPLAGQDEFELARMADAARQVGHARDVAVVRPAAAPSAAPPGTRASRRARQAQITSPSGRSGRRALAANWPNMTSSPGGPR